MIDKLFDSLSLVYYLFIADLSYFDQDYCGDFGDDGLRFSILVFRYFYPLFFRAG